MAIDKHPYVSGSGAILQTVDQLRRAFPAQVSADTLKKYGIASSSESYIINILRFIGALDAESNKTDLASKIFSQHKDEDFQRELAKAVEDSYSDLFEHYGDGTWELEQDSLISYFRATDGTSAVIGRRQATTFQTLAALAGQADESVLRVAKRSPDGAKKAAAKPAKAPKKPTSKGTPSAASKKQQPAKGAEVRTPSKETGASDVALTVRIEVNLPADGDQETYDRIFRSIRKNLLNA